MSRSYARPQAAISRFTCPTCAAGTGERCAGGRVHKTRRAKGQRKPRRK